MEEKKNKRSRGRPSKKQGTNIEELLWVSIRAFAKKGFGGVSLNSLANEAGVADSLLHYHFKNKKELWKKALEFVGKKIQEELDNTVPLIADLDGLQQMKVFNRQIVYISARYPEFQQIVVQEVFSKSERSKWLIEELLTPIYSHHERLRTQEQEKGTIKSIPSANLVSFMFGAITTFFARSYQMEAQFGIDSFDKEQVEQHAQIMNDLIFNGLINREKTND